MALSRRAAEFRRKVLEKLFPASSPDVAISSTEGRSVLQSPVSEQAGSTEASEGCPCLPDKKDMILPPRKMYTVTPPPEDYVLEANSEVKYENSESSDDHDRDASALQDLSSLLANYLILQNEDSQRWSLGPSAKKADPLHR